jgi:ribosomal-protein-alanine N-acetyltransferase
MLQAVKDWSRSEGATEVVLEVRESSAAVEFYREFGFEQTGRRSAYYRDPVEDAVIMRAALPGTT